MKKAVEFSWDGMESIDKLTTKFPWLSHIGEPEIAALAYYVDFKKPHPNITFRGKTTIQQASF